MLYLALGHLIKNKTFICSSYVMLLWKLALEQLVNPLDSSQSLDDVGLKIDPFECLPKNILELPKYFPDYWEVIEYHTGFSWPWDCTSASVLRIFPLGVIR